MSTWDMQRRGRWSLRGAKGGTRARIGQLELDARGEGLATRERGESGVSLEGWRQRKESTYLDPSPSKLRRWP